MDRARRTGGRGAPGRSASRGVVVCLLALLAGCGLLEPSPALVIRIDGRAERGVTAGLTAEVDGEAAPSGGVRWSAEPAGVVEIRDGTIRFLEAGSVVLEATAGDARGDRHVDVSVPPQILLEGVRDGNRDVYRVALDGRELTRLTTDPGEDGNPTSTRGVVVFTSWRRGVADLWRLDGGDGPALLEHLSSGAREQEPALSPDGRRVAFVRSADGAMRVWTGPLAPDDGEPEPATAETELDGGLERAPSWDPAGGRLALMSTAAGDADVYALDLADGAVAPVAVEPGAQVEPAWSPDGRGVVYVTDVEGDAELVRYDRATGARARLTSRPGADGQPAFLRDGRVVYTAWTGETSEIRWLDPARPGVSHPVPLDLERPENPSGHVP